MKEKLSSTPGEMDIVFKTGQTNAKKLEDDLKIIQDWLKFQPHLPTNIENNVIREYIIGAKSNLEKAKQKLDNNFSTRHDISLLFKSRDPSSEAALSSLKSTNIAMLPKLSAEGCRISILTYEQVDIKYYTPNDDLRRLYMINDLWLKKGHLFCGEEAILDFKNFTDKHFNKVGLQLLLMWLNTLKLLPTRLNKFVIINAPGFTETMLKLVKPFMPEKLQKRIFIYSTGIESLNQHFDMKNLPKDLGGDDNITAKELSEYWHEQLTQNKEWFKNDSNFFSDESKRIKDTFNDTEDLRGTFRKINLD